MRKTDLHYDLPPHLIAQQPLPQRSASRMLYLNGLDGALQDLAFTDLPGLLRAGDLLVCNDTRVIPARLYGRKASGGKLEVLVERKLGDKQALAHVRAGKAPKPGTTLHLDGAAVCVMLERRGDWFLLEFSEPVDEVLERAGHMPLPPYIARPDTADDLERYQTVFARHKGAVAAPTAGLHFDAAFLQRLQAMGVDRAFVTLHVGSGTFQPLRAENLADHHMHAEHCEVPPATVDAIRQIRAAGGRVVAVGTTVVRALESACRAGELQPFCGDTAIFITPGFRFRCVDALVTNFHLPESTLLALVCAFAGYTPTMQAYRHAVAQSYRFFSYGDAMFVTRA